jgi:hypothetical protein
LLFPSYFISKIRVYDIVSDTVSFSIFKPNL